MSMNRSVNLLEMHSSRFRSSLESVIQGSSDSQTESFDRVARFMFSYTPFAVFCTLHIDPHGRVEDEEVSWA